MGNFVAQGFWSTLFDRESSDVYIPKAKVTQCDFTRHISIKSPSHMGDLGFFKQTQLETVDSGYTILRVHHRISFGGRLVLRALLDRSAASQLREIAAWTCARCLCHRPKTYVSLLCAFRFRIRILLEFFSRICQAGFFSWLLRIRKDGLQNPERDSCLSHF